jgi:GNAT superfamily N-acetyltransferase
MNSSSPNCTKNRRYESHRFRRGITFERIAVFFSTPEFWLQIFMLWYNLCCGNIEWEAAEVSMNYIIRKAAAEDVRSALDLALRVFAEYEAPEYEPGAIGHFKEDCIDNADYINNYIAGKHLMFVALDGDKIIGMINERGDGHISMVFVDGAYHRQGIATAMMEQMVCVLKLCGNDKITLNSSPFGLPFYLHFGFMPTDSEQHKDGFIFTPMAYTPNEILDDFKGDS